MLECVPLLTWSALYLSFYVFWYTIYVLPWIWLSIGGMWQLRIVYLCCNFALGYNYCMLSVRVSPSHKGFFMIAERRSRMLHGLGWGNFRVVPSCLQNYVRFVLRKIKLSRSVLCFWGSRSSHLQQRLDFSACSGRIDVTCSAVV